MGLLLDYLVLVVLCCVVRLLCFVACFVKCLIVWFSFVGLCLFALHVLICVVCFVLFGCWCCAAVLFGDWFDLCCFACFLFVVCCDV